MQVWNSLARGSAKVDPNVEAGGVVPVQHGLPCDRYRRHQLGLFLRRCGEPVGDMPQWHQENVARGDREGVP
jgi:hypothetical protein